jgi:hypothetical protein
MVIHLCKLAKSTGIAILPGCISKLGACFNIALFANSPFLDPFRASSNCRTAEPAVDADHPNIGQKNLN